MYLYICEWLRGWTKLVRLSLLWERYVESVSVWPIVERWQCKFSSERPKFLINSRANERFLCLLSDLKTTYFMIFPIYIHTNIYECTNVFYFFFFFFVLFISFAISIQAAFSLTVSERVFDGNSMPNVHSLVISSTRFVIVFILNAFSCVEFICFAFTTSKHIFYGAQILSLSLLFLLDLKKKGLALIYDIFVTWWNSVFFFREHSLIVCFENWFWI